MSSMPAGHESAGDALPESECAMQKQEPLKEAVGQSKALGRPILLIAANKRPVLKVRK